MKHILQHQTTTHIAKKTLLLLFVAFIGILPLTGQTTDYIFRHFTTTYGLLNNEVKTVLRDHYGYLWIGTVSGLNRWDGYRLKAFENAEGRMGMLPEGDILGLEEDAQGNIWVGGRGETVVYVREQERFVPADDFLKSNPDTRKKPHALSKVPSPFDKDLPTVDHLKQILLGLAFQVALLDLATLDQLLNQLRLQTTDDHTLVGGLLPQGGSSATDSLQVVLKVCQGHLHALVVIGIADKA